MDYLVAQVLNIPQFAITWLCFFGAGFFLFLIQVFRKSADFTLNDLYNTCIPVNIFSSKSFHMDVIIYLIRKSTDFLFAVPGAATVGFVSSGVWLLLSQLAFSPGSAPLGYWATGFCTVVMIVTVEFTDYLTHFLDHKVPFLWELHKVHHSADFLNPLTSKRGHSLPLISAGVISGAIQGIPAGLLMFTFGLSLFETLALNAFASKVLTICTLDPLKHSHIPVSLGWFDRIFISPHMHQIHHSKVEAHWDKNFGTNLSVFDWLFGTKYKPKKGEEILFGISGYSDASLQKFNTLNGAYITPIKRSWNALLTLCKNHKASAPDAHLAVRDSHQISDATSGGERI